MSVMVPLQLKFIEGKMYSVLAEVESSSSFLDEVPYMLTVSLDGKPQTHSVLRHKTGPGGTVEWMNTK